MPFRLDYIVVTVIAMGEAADHKAGGMGADMAAATAAADVVATDACSSGSSRKLLTLRITADVVATDACSSGSSRKLLILLINKRSPFYHTTYASPLLRDTPYSPPS